MTLLIYILGWIPMIPIAILNGLIRQYGYGKYMTELHAHQLSSITGILLFAGYTWFLSLLRPLQSVGQAVTVGLIWLVMTVAFEFLFGHYVAGHSWSRLLQDYNLFAGRVWSLVLLAVALLPYLVYSLSGSGV